MTSVSRERAVDQARRDPAFLGWALRYYQQSYGLTDTGLALWLGCSLSELPQLAVKRWPDPSDSDYVAALRQLAAQTSCDPRRLMTLHMVCEPERFA
ncbi:MAG: hypothetical protein HY329_21150 [Chloroflexi bacterium]|nr:hypothetical protein [Chloroflexota bacterium]